MSVPLVAIGGAVLEVIGLSPTSIGYRSEARWPGQDVFDDDPFYQATGMGERCFRLKLAARPHTMGGLGQYQVLKAHHERQDVVPFIRLAAGQVGEVYEDVAVTEIGHEEEKIAPDGVGRRHAFDVKLLVVGRHAGGGGSIADLLEAFL